MLTSFEGTTIERDEDGLLWVYQNGSIVCEAFYRSADETPEEMASNGYILVPYLFEGEEVWVEVANED